LPDETGSVSAARQHADRLAERGYQIGTRTVQKHLVDHGLGRRAAANTAATTGLWADPGRYDEPFAFCHCSPAPGQLECGRCAVILGGAISTPPGQAM
jgi:hypothetical protein